MVAEVDLAAGGEVRMVMRHTHLIHKADNAATMMRMVEVVEVVEVPTRHRMRRMDSSKTFSLEVATIMVEVNTLVVAAVEEEAMAHRKASKYH